MFDKLDALEERFALVSEKISDPEIIADQDSWRKYCKEHSDLTPIVNKYKEYKTAKQIIQSAHPTYEIDDLLIFKKPYKGQIIIHTKRKTTFSRCLWSIYNNLIVGKRCLIPQRAIKRKK